MGLYDRSYYQEDENRFGGGSGIGGGDAKSVTSMLIVVNVAIFILDAVLLGGRRGLVSNLMLIEPNTIVEPWMWWKSITYAFAHAPNYFWHIFGNMLTLFFFGRTLERQLGRFEFLRVYLFTAIFSGFLWSTLTYFSILPAAPGLYGASGAVSGIFLLFVFRNPKATLLAGLIVPVPAWLLGVFWVLYDMLGWVAPQGVRVAHSVHLAGMAFVTAYHFGRWNFGFLPSFDVSKLFKRRPKLRVHSPSEVSYDELDDEADAILAKVSRTGRESLSDRERKILDEYSRRMQQKLR